jgi:hypothetical protein
MLLYATGMSEEDLSSTAPEQRGFRARRDPVHAAMAIQGANMYQFGRIHHAGSELTMMRPWQIVVIVLIALSIILAIADRAILQPMYLLVLALVVMYGTNTKLPWG